MNIYPSYRCNFQCKFCTFYKNNGKMIDLNWIEDQFKQHKNLCTNINILGGEPSILPVDYQNDLVDMCIKYSGDKPYYITNLNIISPVLIKCKPIISYDFGLRQNNKHVLNNILKLKNKFAISTVLTSYLIEEIGPTKYLNFIGKLKNCIRADLDIYYKQNNSQYDFTPDNNKLLDFISKVMNDQKVNLAPYSAMKANIDTSINNISDYFAFFPDNEYGVRLNYKNGSYKLLNTYEEAINYYYDIIKNNKLCNKCEFNKTCWYPYSDNTCHGNKDMLKLFKESINDKQ